ncbi:MAG: ATP-binding cassette domain-containing protein [Pseudomonadota bacterium]|jgi:lipopolysaccharide export system ATP-binding protein|nr:ATP-binding cassette domain-containing protein [Pseudomonadota bacterium]|tara:strand:+ start:756 stop:1466 length:711 start_codon:yes stop_codon:yes gene_type:complete
MIKVENISRSVKSKILFKNISFDLPNNKITGLLGANGAGKTSLFKALAGLSKIDNGSIRFYEKNLHSMSLEERSNAGLNYVPQENSLFDDLSLQENLEAVIELKFKAVSEEKFKQIKDLLEVMKLTDKAKTKSKFLSGGEKRKTEILRSILLDSKYILLDEPFAGVDPISVEEIIKILKKFKKNLGIFISDHNFRDVINVCDEIILLNQGELLLQGTPNQVKNNPIAKKLYFGELN